MVRWKLGDAIRELVSEQDYCVISNYFGTPNLCRDCIMGSNLNYYSLYNLQEKQPFVFQTSGETLEKTSLRLMDPFSPAVVIVKDRNQYFVHNFIPTAFSGVVVLNCKEDIKFNFDNYTVISPDGTVVESYDALDSLEEFVAISKKTFSDSNHPDMHMLLRWGSSYSSLAR